MGHYMIFDRPMTIRERYERRKKRLAENPFLRELDRKARAKYRAKNKEKIREYRLMRASRPDIREKERQRQAERRATMTPEDKAKVSLYNKMYRKRNETRIAEKQHAYAASEHGKAVKAAQRERRRIRMETDAEFREAQRAKSRAAYAARVRTPKGRAKFLKTLSKLWEEVVAGGPQRIETYMKRAKPANRSDFAKWYSRRLIDTKSGLGHIVEAADEEVPSHVETKTP